MMTLQKICIIIEKDTYGSVQRAQKERIMINRTIVINRKITEKFNDFIENGRILFLKRSAVSEKQRRQEVF